MINSVNLVYEQTLAEEKLRSKPRSPRHYPSSACAILAGKFSGHCRRATWYEWRGYEKTNPPDAPALFKMRTGNLIHEMLDGLLERSLLEKGYKVEHLQLEGEGRGDEVRSLWQMPGLRYPFSGKLDKRFVSPEGERILAEWKSTYGRGIDDVKANGPKEEALLQLYIYLRQDAWPVDATILMYAARDSGMLLGYWVTLDGAGLKIEYMNSAKTQLFPITDEDVVGATAMLEEYLEGDEPPPRDFQDKDWQDKYCSYRNLCHGIDKRS